MAKNFREKLKQKNNESLLDDSIENSETEQVVNIPKGDIYSGTQVRKFFNQDTIIELGKSMELDGQIQPIIVCKADRKGHKIQKGERRWRAAMSNDQITHVQCIVREPGTISQQLVENLHRDDLSPFETGRALIAIMEEENIKDNGTLSSRVSISEPRISQFLKAAECPEYIEQTYESGQIGDVDTINSLRIAHGFNEKETKELLGSEDVVSRKEAQALTKKLKAEAKSGVKSKPKKSPKGIRVKLQERLGIIELNGMAEEGYIVVKLDDSKDLQTVPASDIEVVGYHVN